MGFLGYGLTFVVVLCLLTGSLSIKSSHWKVHKCCAKVHRPAAIPNPVPGFTGSSEKKTTSPPIMTLDPVTGSTRSGGEKTTLPPTPLTACGKKIFRATLSELEKDKILHFHNSVRLMVAEGHHTQGNPGPQPGSEYLNHLEWDDELATVAQDWANQCQNSKGGKLVIEGKELGQNFVMIISHSFWEPDDMVESWKLEMENFDHHLVSSYKDPLPTEESYRNYTQMVWGKTTHVGCGIVYSITDDDLHQSNLVCNYAPRGNIVGEPVYKTH
ncbi:venom allergen 5-like [Venturia canescens]|uniref:venom allergen 5-like n=1 Tax=Venturia canescens TaxID=32260 RepID=UPI001C9BF47D|nr:venom allergen 5-like [Venturia canescens]